jgi:hypothetical protein
VSVGGSDDRTGCAKRARVGGNRGARYRGQVECQGHIAALTLATRCLAAVMPFDDLLVHRASVVAGISTAVMCGRREAGESRRVRDTHLHSQRKLERQEREQKTG